MARTRTIYIDLQKFNLDKDAAAIVTGLMMACNDLAIANQCSVKIEEDKTIPSNIRSGVQMYFVRLYCGHLNEALTFIEEIKNSPKLLAEVDKCAPFAQEAFRRLEACLRGGSLYKDFTTYVTKIRHKTAFHYDLDRIKEALTVEAGREKHNSKITLGSKIGLWRFDLADEIIDSKVCIQFWGLKEGPNLPNEADRVLGFIYDSCKALIDFGSAFSRRYIMDNAAI